MSQVTFVHACDAYHIEDSKNDPGAPRVITLLKKLRDDGIKPLVVHSGDIFSPSLSAFTMNLVLLAHPRPGSNSRTDA